MAKEKTNRKPSGNFNGGKSTANRSSSFSTYQNKSSGSSNRRSGSSRSGSSRGFDAASSYERHQSKGSSSSGSRSSTGRSDGRRSGGSRPNTSDRPNGLYLNNQNTNPDRLNATNPAPPSYYYYF